MKGMCSDWKGRNGPFLLLLAVVCNSQSTCQYGFPLFSPKSSYGAVLAAAGHTERCRGTTAAGTERSILGQLNCLPKPGSNQTWLQLNQQLSLAAPFITNSEFPFFFPFIPEQIIHVPLTQRRIYVSDLVGTSYLLLSQTRCQKSGMQPPLTLHGHSLYLSPFLH